MRKVKSKKVFAVLMALVMTLAAMLQMAPMPVSAAPAIRLPLPPGPHLGLDLESRVYSAMPGQEFVIDVDISFLNIDVWGQVYFYLYFDHTVVELIRYSSASFASRDWTMGWVQAGGIVMHTPIAPGVAYIGIATGDGENVPHEISFGLRFRILDTTPLGENIEIRWSPYGAGVNAYDIVAGNPVFSIPVIDLVPLTGVSQESYTSVFVGELTLDAYVTGTGLNAADVTVTHADINDANWSGPAGTLGNRFRTNFANPVRGYVYASAPGFEPGRGLIGAYTNGAAVANIVLEPVIRIPGRGVLVGQITDSDTGLGIGGATVMVTTADGEVIEVTTSPAGNYFVNGLEPGEVTVLASALGYNSRFYPNNPAVIVADGETVANIALTPVVGPDVYTLTVVVTGNGLVWDDIVLTHGSTVFEQSGNVFRVDTTSPLTGSLTASAIGFESATRTIPGYTNNRALLEIELDREDIIVGRGVLRGQVRDIDTGVGIEGADVTVYTAAGVRHTTVTNHAGNYMIMNIEPGEVTVLASAVGYYADFYLGNPAIIVADNETVADIELEAHGYTTGGYTLIVTVTGVDIIGNPIDMTAVTVTSGATTLTNRNGNIFVITTENPLTDDVTASASGFHNESAAIVYDSYNTARATLAMRYIDLPVGTGGISGIVRRASDNSPIEGAVVVAVDAEGNELATAITGPSGHYALLGLSPIDQYFRVIVSRNGYIPQSRDVFVEEGLPLSNADFYLVASGIDGYTLIVNLANVTDLATATVRRNDVLMTFENGIWIATGTSRAAVVGELRAVAVGFLPQDHEVLEADFNGVLDRTLRVNLVMESETELPGEGVLQGFVRRADNRATAIPNAVVTAIHSDGTRHETTADADGFYYFTGLEAGTYVVIANANGFNIGTAEGPVVLTDTEGANANVYLEVGFDNFLLVVNVEPAGAVAGAEVRFASNVINNVGGNTWARSLQLPMAGPNIIQVTSAGYETRTRDLLSEEYVDGIAFVTVRLQQVAQEGVLQGYVFDVDTMQRLANATVSIVNIETGYTRQMQTNYDGFYRFENLALASYNVIAWAEDYSVEASPNTPVTLPAGRGVHENVYLSLLEPGDIGYGDDYRLVIAVAGPAEGIVTILMEDAAENAITLTQVDTTNVWVATGNTHILGEITVTAPMFVRTQREVTVADYSPDNYNAWVVITPEEISAVVRFHLLDEDGNPITIDLPLEQLGLINPASIPVPYTRYGLPRTPGWAFMGWYEELFERMHYVNNTNRATAFDFATTPITEAMLTDGVFELFGSWLQYGDVNGDGAVNFQDHLWLQNYIMRRPYEIVRETSDVNVDNLINFQDHLWLQNFIMIRPYVLGVPHPDL